MAKRRANGEGSLYKRKDGTWTAQYTDCNGKKRYLYGKTQQIVKDKLKEALYHNDNGIVLETKKMTFSQWMMEWLEVYARPTIRETTYVNWRNTIEKHIEPHFRNVQLRELRPDMLQKLINEKLKKRLDNKPGGYSTMFVVGIKSRMYGALEKAVELNLIAKNPAERVKLPPKSTKDIQVLTKEEQRELEKTIIDTMQTDNIVFAFLLMLYTGLRIGEALGLQIGDIDLDKAELTVRRSMNYVQLPDATETGYGKKGQRKTGDPKSKSSKRTIPLSPFIVEHIRQHLERRAREVGLLSEVWKNSPRHTEKWIDEDYIFLSSLGNATDRSTMRVKLLALCKKAGIPAITPHGLRHTFATRWIEAGLDVKTLSEILGHADVRMTLNTYTHSLSAQKVDSMKQFGAFYSKDL